MLVPSIIYNRVKKAEAFDKMPSSPSNPRGQEHLLSCFLLASLRREDSICKETNKIEQSRHPPLLAKI
jgi:hypothetical protein